MGGKSSKEEQDKKDIDNLKTVLNERESLRRQGSTMTEAQINQLARDESKTYSPREVEGRKDLRMTGMQRVSAKPLRRSTDFVEPGGAEISPGYKRGEGEGEPGWGEIKAKEEDDEPGWDRGEGSPKSDSISHKRFHRPSGRKKSPKIYKKKVIKISRKSLRKMVRCSRISPIKNKLSKKIIV